LIAYLHYRQIRLTVSGYEAKENQERFECDEAYQILVCTDNVTSFFLHAFNEVSLERHSWRTKLHTISRYQNAGKMMTHRYISSEGVNDA
jgi:hypothetical protein